MRGWTPQVAAQCEHRRILCINAGDGSHGTARLAAETRSGDSIVGVVSDAGVDPGRTRLLRDAIAEQLREGSLPLRRRRPTTVGQVDLVGGGPGPVDLITVRGRRLLAEADVVVADRLGPTGVISELAPEVEIIDVGKRPGHHPVPQDEINEILDRPRAPRAPRRAPEGRRPVRLRPRRRGGRRLPGRRRSCRRRSRPHQRRVGSTGGRHPGHAPRHRCGPARRQRTGRADVRDARRAARPADDHGRPHGRQRARPTSPPLRSRPARTPNCRSRSSRAATPTTSARPARPSPPSQPTRPRPECAIRR